MCIFLIQHFFLFIFPLPGWTLDAARLSCQDAAKEVVASSFCKVVEFPSVQGVQLLWFRKLFSLLCGILVAVAFKGANTLSSRKLKLNVNRGLEEGIRENPLQDFNLISGKTELKQDSTASG